MLPDALAGSRNLTFDKSPSYADTHFFPWLPFRIHEVLPHAKVIFAVCNPTTRLWSHYNHQIRVATIDNDASALALLNLTGSTLSFPALVERLLASDGSDHSLKLRKEFLEKGFYAARILDWFTTYGWSNVHVVNTDELVCGKASMRTALRRVLAFLQLDTKAYPWDSIKASTFSNPMQKYNRHAVPAAEKAMLGAVYAPHNEWLYRLTRRNVDADSCEGR